jgi:hypothetical protein
MTYIQILEKMKAILPLTQDKQNQYNVKVVKVFVYALDSIKKTSALAEVWTIQLTPEIVL